jgi:hypothetical protein
MAECYQKLGDAQARTLYERLPREFGDQQDAAATAKARLSDETRQAAGLIPSGRQITTESADGDETISADGCYLAFTSEDVIVREIAAKTERG